MFRLKRHLWNTTARSCRMIRIALDRCRRRPASTPHPTRNQGHTVARQGHLPPPCTQHGACQQECGHCFTPPGIGLGHGPYSDGLVPTPVSRAECNPVACNGTVSRFARETIPSASVARLVRASILRESSRSRALRNTATTAQIVFTIRAARVARTFFKRQKAGQYQSSWSFCRFSASWRSKGR